MLPQGGRDSATTSGDQPSRSSLPSRRQPGASRAPSPRSDGCSDILERGGRRRQGDQAKSQDGESPAAAMAPLETTVAGEPVKEWVRRTATSWSPESAAPT